MNVSREFAIEQLKNARKTLSEWIKELEKPAVIMPDGTERQVYGEDGPPKGLSVAAMESIPADQFRAELMATAGALAALADT